MFAYNTPNVLAIAHAMRNCGTNVKGAFYLGRMKVAEDWKRNTLANQEAQKAKEDYEKYLAEEGCEPDYLRSA